jgi:hypothetical protein
LYYRIWGRAVRAWPETVMPPVFGKEMEERREPIFQTRVSAIFFEWGPISRKTGGIGDS